MGTMLELTAEQSIRHTEALDNAKELFTVPAEIQEGERPLPQTLEEFCELTTPAMWIYIYLVALSKSKDATPYNFHQ